MRCRPEPMILVATLLTWGCTTSPHQEARRGLREGDLSRAEKHYRECLEDEPDNLVCALEIAHVFRKQRALEKSETALRRIKEPLGEPLLRQALAIQWYELGRAYYSGKRFERARLCFVRARIYLPTNADVEYWYGKSLFRAGYFAAAASTLLGTIEQAPEVAGAYFYLGYIDRLYPFISGTLERTEKQIAIQPSNVESRYRRAILHEVRRRWSLDPTSSLQQIITLFEEIIRLRPEYAPPYFNLYVLLAAKGEIARSDQAFEKYMSLAKNGDNSRINSDLKEDLRRLQ